MARPTQKRSRACPRSQERGCRCRRCMANIGARESISRYPLSQTRHGWRLDLGAEFVKGANGSPGQKTWPSWHPSETTTEEGQQSHVTRLYRGWHPSGNSPWSDGDFWMTPYIRWGAERVRRRRDCRLRDLCRRTDRNPLSRCAPDTHGAAGALLCGFANLALSRQFLRNI